MPIHDVSEAFDATFWDTIMVIRRRQFVDQYGRVSVTNQQFTMLAVVVAASPNDLQRVPNYQQMGKAISIYSISPRLQGPALMYGSGEETQPDQIVWHGSLYVVKLLEDFSGYGRGFIHTIAESVQAVDPAPFPDIIGRA